MAMSEYGNSMLFRIKGLTYVGISEDLYSFEAKAPIIKFVSSVVHNQSGPIAIDQKKNVYLLNFFLCTNHSVQCGVIDNKDIEYVDMDYIMTDQKVENHDYSTDFYSQYEKAKPLRNLKIYISHTLEDNINLLKKTIPKLNKKFNKGLYIK